MLRLTLALLCALPACTPVSLLERRITVTADQFQDLPVPLGFRLNDRHHESHSLSVGSYRYGSFLYTGRLSVPEVSTYLLERMPQHAWALSSRDGVSTDAQRLVFHRDDYTVDYRIERVESLTRIRVEVRTTAAPIAQR